MNRLPILHKLTPSRDNNYRIWFKKHGPEHLVANGRYFNGWSKVVHLDQFQKQIRKSTAFLPKYIDVVHAVDQQFLPIFKKIVFFPLLPDQKLASLITRPKACPIVLGFGMRTHIIQIVGKVEEVGMVPLLACEVYDLGMLLRHIGKFLNESRKWRFSTTILRILLPSIIDCGTHSISRYFPRRNCVSYPRELCQIT